jgi:hypothetical protein
MKIAAKVVIKPVFIQNAIPVSFGAGVCGGDGVHLGECPFFNYGTASSEGDVF